MSELFLHPLSLDQPLADDGAALFDGSASWSGEANDYPLYAMPPVSLEHDAPVTVPADLHAFSSLPTLPALPKPTQAPLVLEAPQQMPLYREPVQGSESSVESDADLVDDEDELEDDEDEDDSDVPPPARTRHARVVAKRGRALVGAPAGLALDGSKSTDAIAAAAASVAAAQFEATKEAKKRGAAPALKRKALAVSGGPQRTQLTKAEVELGATLDLSRDELLNMTSDALEEYAKRLAAQRPLTAEEQKRFKRQRRLIKNRESAQLSRLRKKAYVDELERELNQVKEERDANGRRANAAERQLAAAGQEINYLRSLLAQHPTLSQLAADRSQFAAAPLSAAAADMDEPAARRRRN